MWSGGRCTSAPRVNGTTQYVQNLLHPRVIRTYADPGLRPGTPASTGDTARERSSISSESAAAASVALRREAPPCRATWFAETRCRGVEVSRCRGEMRSLD